MIRSIANELNARIGSRPISHLQEFRKDLKGLNRLPNRHIFSPQTTFGNYAFHVGGRTELQFNIGIESVNNTKLLRHGVAFSFERSQALPDFEVLIPKIARFNEFLRSYPEEFSDMRMWNYTAKRRSSDYLPSPIPPELVASDVFIFLGKMQQIDQIDYELILDDLDRLLSLYRFVEGNDAHPSVAETSGQFEFKPGCTVKPMTTTGTAAKRQLDIHLRHNKIQKALYDYLVSQYGSDAVGTECGNGTGVRVDVVVRHSTDYWFYEIKTATSARVCIREALAQLLEYSFWPGVQEAERLIIVGEPGLDSKSQTFVTHLRDRFSLPVIYKQFDIRLGRLIDSKN